MKAAIGISVLAAMVLMTASAGAEDPIGRLSLGGSVGYSSYALSKVNDRINGPGNEFLEEVHLPGLTGMDPIDFGWTFWADVKYQLPFFRSFFVTGGYGVSSGNSDSPDMDNKLTVEVSQEALHVRLLYVPPIRIQEDTRLFVGGGPLIITNQEVRVTQVNRSNLQLSEQWTEEIFYAGDGLGFQFGVVGEYMMQDRLTFSVDLGYRVATVDYSDWSPRNNVKITLPASAVQERQDRLHYEDTYGGHAFLDWEQTVLKGSQDPRAQEYGPHYEQMVPLGTNDLDIDMSGFQIHFGLRLYLF
ncbi:MAG: outer membrane beta-barrel protein [Candidatus Eisenbacteria bacterium]|nr:outer membrane beta-barrel protein [Candidatus Eisenbacteria bacterium]